MRGLVAILVVAACGDDGGNSPDAFVHPDVPDNANHAPSFTKGADQIVPEDGGTKIVAGWATAIDAHDAGQSVTFEVVADNDNLFAVPTTIDPDGTLTYTPADNANGSTMLTVTLHDDGGTAIGGTDASPPQTFIIGIAGKNDPPHFAPGANISTSLAAGAYAASWATNISTGPANEQQNPMFSITFDNSALFTSPPAVDVAGGIAFTPLACGTSNAAVTLSDGIDATLPAPLTITITCP